MLVKELKDRVSRSEYDVDCRAVAEALIARQARCSNPLSLAGPSGPLNVMPAGPRFTRPTGEPGSPAGPDASSS